MRPGAGFTFGIAQRLGVIKKGERAIDAIKRLRVVVRIRDQALGQGVIDDPLGVGVAMRRVAKRLVGEGDRRKPGTQLG